MHRTLSAYTKCLIVCLFMMTSFAIQSEEKLFLPLDGRKWNIGYQAKNDEGSIIELILQNEEIQDWTELFTIQHFKNISISGEEYVKNLEKTSREKVKKPQSLKFQLIEADPVNLFESSFIFDRSDKKAYSIIGYDEFNLGRVLKGETDLYYIRYSTKDKELFEANKEDWVDRLALAYLASAPHPTQEGQWITLTSNGLYENKELMTLQSSKQFLSYPENGFNFTLPKDWLLEKQSVKESLFDSKYPYTISMLFSSPDRSIYGGVAFFDSPKDDASFVPEAHYLNLFQKQYPKSQLINKGELQTILGQRGNYLILEEGDTKGWITFFNTPERIFRLELWTKKTDFEKNKKEMEKIILNFEISSKVKK